MELLYRSPSLCAKNDLLRYRREIIRTDNAFDGSAGLGNFRTIEEWLERLHGMEPPRAEKYGYFPTLVFLAYHETALCGLLNVRLSDAPLLRTHAGHIGYHVRPSMRRRGIASAMLLHAAALCKEHGITAPVVCTAENNLASAKTALSCGFLPDGTAVLETGERICRFIYPF
ncbi:MAG: GNAT family N-acetyltransferase [Clostridia bacterium]|nr:GNAT family N-acetyltransferase [Clostridia bacterium]